MTEAAAFDFETASQPVAERVTTALARIGIALKTKAWRDAGAERVTPTQGQALAVLRGTPGGLRLNDLASALGVSAPTASDAVAALVAKGFVARDRAEGDRRALTLTLTRDGTALSERVADWPDFLLRAVSTLDSAEQTAFLRGLVKIIRSLQEAGDIPTQRMCVDCVHFRPNMHPGSERPHHCAFVDAAFGDRHLRLDCREHDPATAEAAAAGWLRWTGGALSSPASAGDPT